MRPTMLLLIVLLAAVAAPAQAYDKRERIQEGVRLHDGKDYDGAIVVYQSLLKDHPHDSTAVYELALSWMQRGTDLEELTQIIEAELASGIEQHHALSMILGAAYDTLGQYENGEAALRRGLEKMPDSPKAHYNLGVNLRLQGRWTDAAASFEETLRQKADYASAWFGLGECMEELDQPARSLLATARAAALEPESARGRAAATKLWGLLFTGVEEENPGDATKVNKEITITIPPPSDTAAAPDGAEDPAVGEEAPVDAVTMERLAMSLAATNRYLEEWEKKSDAAFFAYAFESVVAMFSELDVAKNDPFWTLTLPWFDEARKNGHIEALAYTLRRSAGDSDAAAWVEQHAKRVKAYEEWK